MAQNSTVTAIKFLANKQARTNSTTAVKLFREGGEDQLNRRGFPVERLGQHDDACPRVHSEGPVGRPIEQGLVQVVLKRYEQPQATSKDLEFIKIKLALGPMSSLRLHLAASSY